MKIVSKILPFVFFLSLSQSALAAWSGNLYIDVLKVQSNGTYLSLDGFENSDSSIECGKDAFFLSSEADNYEARTSFLLAAYMAGKSINVSYYGCSSEHAELIRLSSVSLQ
jgi:hypothetical protein